MVNLCNYLVENIVAKGEIALLSRCFQKLSAADVSKCVYKWERVRGLSIVLKKKRAQIIRLTRLIKLIKLFSPIELLHCCEGMGFPFIICYLINTSKTNCPKVLGRFENNSTQMLLGWLFSKIVHIITIGWKTWPPKGGVLFPYTFRVKTLKTIEVLLNNFCNSPFVQCSQNQHMLC